MYVRQFPLIDRVEKSKLQPYFNQISSWKLLSTCAFDGLFLFFVLTKWCQLLLFFFHFANSLSPGSLNKIQTIYICPTWLLFSSSSLVIADLCVGLLSVLTDIIWRMTVSWKAGNVACKAIRFAQASVTYASTYVLVALSIDRYDAITHPMNFSGCCKFCFWWGGDWILYSVLSKFTLNCITF